MVRSIVAVAFLVSVVALAPSQTSQDPQTFRSGVEVLRIPVTVVDGRGQPVRDLKPADFSVKVDGRERKLLFAEPFGRGDDALAAAAGPVIPSYVANTESDPGRIVAIVVDLMSIKQGHEAVIMDTAARLVESLGPNDAIGLMPIPGKGVDLTRDHTRVSAALRTLRGTSNPLPFMTHFLSLREAVAFEQLNRRVMNEAIERECCVTCRNCPGELREEARDLLQFARQHVGSVMTSITSLASALKPVEAPKTIVVMSAGLPFDQENIALFGNLERALKEAGIMVYAVQVSQGDNDAGNMRRPGVGIYQAADITSGLANIATMAGGAMFHGVGTAGGVFERLHAEMTTGYQLGVESSAADADGRARDVKVTVSREGLTVRSRPTIVLTARSVEPPQRLVNLLAEPVDVTELPLAAAAYTARGEEPDTLKMIVAAEVGDEVKTNGTVRYAMKVTQEDKVVFQTDDVAIQGENGARILTAAQLRPGRYMLRIGAVDETSRAGTLQMPVTVGLRVGGTLQFSDLFVGLTDKSFRPIIRATRGQMLDAFVELYTSDPEVFSKASVKFEVRRAGDSKLAAEQDGTLRPTDLERRQFADTKLPTNGWPAGRFIVSAIISLDGKPLSRVSRAILLK